MAFKKLAAELFKMVAMSLVTANIYENSHKVTSSQIRFALETAEYEEALIMILNFKPEITLPVSE